jgi:hypothetical protein
MMSLIRHGFMRGLGVMSHAGVGMLVPLGDLALRAIGHHALRWAGRLLGVCPFDGRFGMVASLCIRPRIASSHVACTKVRSDPDFELGMPTAPMLAAAKRAVFERYAGVHVCARARAYARLRAYAWVCACARACMCSRTRARE